jgi:general secretion pathway protein E
MILFEALRRGASDIHVHPMEDRLAIRFRVDGMLVDAFSPPQTLAPPSLSRLKVMTELDIANRHSPQDGHTSVRIGSKKIDIRLSVIPTVYGERIVLRLLDQSQTQLSLDEIGMTKGLQTQLMDWSSGPPASSWSPGPPARARPPRSTPRSPHRPRQPQRHDHRGPRRVPPRRHQPDAGQPQARRHLRHGLRALLRQDPDVILVGEVRDPETAQLAIQASLTGHLVLATLHTNDAPSSIPRLLDIGVEPYLVTSSLLGVLAQRLMRKICPVCRGTGHADGAPCERCFGSGYKGRLAVHELMIMTDELRRLTGARADGVTLYEAAVNGGFEPMKIDAMEKVAKGLTDEAEVFRVLH